MIKMDDYYVCIVEYKPYEVDDKGNEVGFPLPKIITPKAADILKTGHELGKDILEKRMATGNDADLKTKKDLKEHLGRYLWSKLQKYIKEKKYKKVSHDELVEIIGEAAP